MGRIIRRLSMILLVFATACMSITACSVDDSFAIIDDWNAKIDQKIVGVLSEKKEAFNSEVVKKNVANISDGNYAYEQLSDEEKTIYNEMISTILEQEQEIDLSTTDTAKMRKAYVAMIADYGSLFWVDGYSYTRFTRGNELVGLRFIPNYTMTKVNRKEFQNQIDNVVEQWLLGVSITDTDYEKLKYVFETLIQNVDYVEESEYNQNIISVFINQQTVCQGYASAAQYMLKQLGIESVIITGRANYQSHAWNLVKLENNYYYMDTTWGNSTYLDEDSMESKFVNYNYLCMTTDELELTHSASEEIALPQCDNIDNNYYVKEDKYFDMWDEDKIGEIFKSGWETNKTEISVKFANSELYHQAKDYFITEKKITEYCEGIQQVYFIENKHLNVLTISFY